MHFKKCGAFLNSTIKLFQKRVANFFCKVTEYKYLGFKDHLIFVVPTQLC